MAVGPLGIKITGRGDVIYIKVEFEPQRLICVLSNLNTRSPRPTFIRGTVPISSALHCTRAHIDLINGFIRICICSQLLPLLTYSYGFDVPTGRTVVFTTPPTLFATGPGGRHLLIGCSGGAVQGD